jgi:hypothetical protein
VNEVTKQFYRLLAFGFTVLICGIGTAQADQRRGRFVEEDAPQRQEMLDRMEQRRERLRALREDMERQVPPRPGPVPHLLPPERDPRGNNVERPVRSISPDAPINPRRLSPEERRQLRRDVRDADNEIYRR